jgi:hypothetical protein
MSQGSARRVSVASRLSFPRARAGDEVEKARRAGERIFRAIVIRQFMVVRVVDFVTLSRLRG